MRKSPLEKTITDIATPVIEDLGFALVCVKIVGEGSAQNVQIMAEEPKTGRLGIEDCTKISRALSPVLEVEDPINGAYRLEISSPGIDRPLTRIEDFLSYEGYEAKLESSTPNENGQKKFRGRLKGLDGETILMTTDQGDAKIAFGSLVKAKLVLTDELIQKTAKA